MRYLFLLGFSLLLVACNNQPYKFSRKIYKQQIRDHYRKLKSLEPVVLGDASIKSDVIETVNFSFRKPNLIVIHHTAQDSCGQTYRTFTKVETQVSSHYVICKDGTVTQMLDDLLRGWHAGRGSWGTINDVNSISIGIELDNNGEEEFPDDQIKSLLALLTVLKEKYSIPTSNFIGHADLAPTRKVDPNVNFPWEELAKSGFGQWYSSAELEKIPHGFDEYMALRLIGYSLQDTCATIKAFKRHFIPHRVDSTLSDFDKQVLFALTSGE